jgi:NAD(P)-dependent dehydrogenase (short-subunit alcohol dehydrogenase family)
MTSNWAKSREAFPVKWYGAFVESMPSQADKHVAITGTTSGTGLEAAKAIVGKGGHVISLNRPSERAAASLATLQQACKDGGTATQVDCDLQSLASVHEAATRVKQILSGKGLDALVNNAGARVFACQRIRLPAGSPATRC